MHPQRGSLPLRGRVRVVPRQGASGAAAPAAVEELGAAAEEGTAAPTAPSPGSNIGVSTPLSFTLILSHLDVLRHKSGHFMPDL